MAAAKENPKLLNPSDSWTVVVPRRGKQRRKPIPKIQTLVEKSWSPTDTEIDPQRESKLAQKMQSALKKLESSDFYRFFVEQLQDPRMLEKLSRVASSESEIQMVIYGIGSIESYEPPRLQLSLAILLKRKFNCIGEIEVFDPILSYTETRVLEGLGCNVLRINEDGRREVEKPTLFFMPHCEAKLYDNLLEANWRVELLNRIILFGNSFGRYEEFVSEFKTSVADSAKFILKAKKFAEEVGIETVSDDFFKAFHETSWHFFELGEEFDLNL